MNTQRASTLFVPSKALIIHKPNIKNGDTDSFYVEKHDITSKEGKYALGPGEPVSRNQLMDLADAIKTKEGIKIRFKTVMPQRVLFHTNTGRAAGIMWWSPPQRRKLLTKSELKVKQGMARVPGMVWMVVNDELRVFAVKGNGRPDGNTKLFNAPFWNVYGDGRVCLGTAKVKMKYAQHYEEIIAAYEQMFWGSYFSTFNTEKQCKKELRNLWNAEINTEHPFPQALLIANKSYKVINNLINKR